MMNKLIVLLLFPLFAVSQTTIKVTMNGQSVPAKSGGDAVVVGNGGGVTPLLSYTLTAPAKTSAGVYNTSGQLVRTLWSGVDRPAGTYSLASAWDGKMDDLTTNAAAGNYTVRVQSNNLSATWEPPIGNTSDSITGPTVHRTYIFFTDIIVVGNALYACADFAEREGSTYKINIADPQKKVDVLPSNLLQQATQKLAWDGTRLYRGGSIDLATYVEASKLDSMMDYNKYLSFSGQRAYFGNVGYRAADKDSPSNRITGMAIQAAGNYMVTVRKLANRVRVMNKITGQLIQTYLLPRPANIKFDDDGYLWICHNDNRVVKYFIDNDNGSLTKVDSITGFTRIDAIAFRGDTLAVADVGTYHQIKAYSKTTKSLLWTLGRAENYGTNSTVYNDKFSFRAVRDDEELYSGMAFQANGWLWVNDRNNCRLLQFNNQRQFVTQVAFQPTVKSMFVDPNNPSRVMGNSLEYEVDYAKPLLKGNTNGAWKLVRNWGQDIPARHYSLHDQFRNFTTFPANGRTYAQVIDLQNNDSWQIVELVTGGGVRFTGLSIQRYYDYGIKKDGSVYGVNRFSTNGVETNSWVRQGLQSFTNTNNPIWSAASPITYTNQIQANNLGFGNNYNHLPEMTSTKIWPIFNPYLGGGYHLGGVDSATGKIMFATAKTVELAENTRVPADGSFDIGTLVGGSYKSYPNAQGVLTRSGNPGAIATSIDSIIAYIYNGEFRNNAQSNYINLFSDKGLFLYQFGTEPNPAVQPPLQALAEMAGNNFSTVFVKVGGVYYAYTQDESYHGAVHRWKITGTIQNHDVKIPKQ